MTDAAPENHTAANTNSPAIWKLRRARRFWRVLFLLALAVAALALWSRFGEGNGFGGEDASGPHIARIVIDGTIFTNPDRRQIIEDLAEDENVRGVILAINSPGGTTAGGEELYDALGKLRAKKPIVATIDELGASAAYMTAISADRIFARRLSIVGSIGVLLEHMNARKLLDTVGIELDKVQSGPLKAEPDLNDPLEGPVRASLQALIDDSYQWFVDVVAERRNLPRPTALALADGRVLTGRQALAAKLIDEVGGAEEALAWLEANKGTGADLPVVTVWPLPENPWDNPLRWVTGEARAAFGLPRQGPIALDGLVSLWQAP